MGPRVLSQIVVIVASQVARKVLSKTRHLILFITQI